MDPRGMLRLPEDDKENTRLGLTICTQKASRFNKGSRRSQLALKGIPLSSRQQLARQRKKKKNAVLFHKSRRVFKVNKVYQTFRP